MGDKEIYKELVLITKSKQKSPESIKYIPSFINNPSVKIKAKVLWI